MNKFNIGDLKIFLFASTVVFFNIFFYYNFPIFPDEITNNFLSTLNSIHLGKKHWLIQSCTEDNYKVSTIIFLLNWFYSLPYYLIENNQIFRFFHIFLGTLLFILIIYTLRDFKNLILILIVIYSWPLSLINSYIIVRPEYFIILMVLSLIYSIRFKSIFSILLLLISYSFALNAHAKALYFCPLLVYFLVFYFRIHNNKYYAIGGIFYLLIISYEYYEMYNFLSVGCSYEYINNILSAYQVNPFTFFSNPLKFFNGIYSANDLIRIDRALSQIFLRNNYDIGYLPNIVKYNNIVVLLNMLYVYLLVIYFKNVFIIIKFNLIIYLYIFTVITIFILNANKASYDVFMFLNLLLLLPAFGLGNDKK